MNFYKKNAWVNIGGLISILLITYCIVYIYNYYSTNDILWHYPPNTRINDERKKQLLSPNEIGDSIGGILNPIVGLVASILTFLAFYMQKRANDEIRKQFKIQQLEGQFYEMLRLHKENVNEIELQKEHRILKGRAAFHYAVVELRSIFEGIVPTYSLEGGIQNNLKNRLPSDQIQETIFSEKLNFAYRIFFWNDVKKYPQYTIGEDPTIHSFAVSGNVNNVDKFNWNAILGHYYRHLFQMVKFIANNKELKYDAKMGYLKIVRAQLSSYEQVMLFYNWLCEDYGGAWEEDDTNGNKFFTEYKMIHNLCLNELMPGQFLVNTVNNLIDKYNKNKNGTPLFEFQGKETDHKWAIDNL